MPVDIGGYWIYYNNWNNPKFSEFAQVTLNPSNTTYFTDYSEKALDPVLSEEDGYTAYTLPGISKLPENYYSDSLNSLRGTFTESVTFNEGKKWVSPEVKDYIPAMLSPGDNFISTKDFGFNKLKELNELDRPKENTKVEEEPKKINFREFL